MVKVSFLPKGRTGCHAITAQVIEHPSSGFLCYCLVQGSPGLQPFNLEAASPALPKGARGRHHLCNTSAHS